MPRVLPSAARFVMGSRGRSGRSGRITALALTLLMGGSVTMTHGQAPNALSSAERKAGWKLLFDGESLAGWKGFKKDTPGAGWKAVDGVLQRAAEGGDLLTVEQFGDFELTLDWKIEKGGNSGIFFRVVDEGEQAWWSGPEVQILDNAVHRDGKNSLTSAGSNYAVHPPVRDVTKPIGSWNTVRLLVKGAHVEHWMNGVKLLEYELWSPDWETRVKASKFGKSPLYELYGRAKRGHIAIQDHGDPVWFRNIKIRVL